MSLGADLQQAWRTRSARERRILVAGLAVVLLLVTYGWLWRPMVADLARLQDQLPRLRAQAAQLDQAGDEIARLRARAPAGRIERAELGTLLTRSSAMHQIAGVALAPDADGARVKVTLERARFESWLAWIDELHRSHRIVLVSARLSALDAPGMVRIEAEFAPALERP